MIQFVLVLGMLVVSIGRAEVSSIFDQGATGTADPDGQKTYFERLGDLYQGGGMPSYPDFNPRRIPKTKSIFATDPWMLSDGRLVTVDKSDPVIGTIRIASVFKLELNGHPVSVQTGQNCLLGIASEEFCGDRTTPLRKNAEANALESDHLRSFDCNGLTRWRATHSKSGLRVLISETLHNDKRQMCNPLANGATFGDVLGRAYAILSEPVRVAACEQCPPALSQCPPAGTLYFLPGIVYSNGVYFHYSLNGCRLRP